MGNAIRHALALDHRGRVNGAAVGDVVEQLRDLVAAQVVVGELVARHPLRAERFVVRFGLGRGVVGRFGEVDDAHPRPGGAG